MKPAVQRNINFESITEEIEPLFPSGRIVFHVFAALAEFERNLVRERTFAGLTAARARGQTRGYQSSHPKRSKPSAACSLGYTPEVRVLDAGKHFLELNFIRPQNSVDMMDE